jgi:hypothetical protein
LLFIAWDCFVALLLAMTGAHTVIANEVKRSFQEGSTVITSEAK